MSGRIEIIYWRDIPAQVIARSQGDVRRLELPGRFQAAIDRAAELSGATDTDVYLAAWRKEHRPIDDEPAAVAAEEVAAIESAFGEGVLADYVANGGWKP